jgi:hypothetical protein
VKSSMSELEQALEAPVLGAPSAGPARRGLEREEPSRARMGRYENLTIFLLQKCPP